MIIICEKRTSDLALRVQKLLSISRAQAIDIVCKELDELLLMSRWDEVSAIMDSLVEYKLPLAILLNVLELFPL